MEIIKSTRHAKITGDLGEHLTLYWLSKHGFECARVDHTGIDIIARNPKRPEMLGISVKSRSRLEGTEGSALLIERQQFEKVQQACDTFFCVPYFALLIDGKGIMSLYLMPMSRLLADLNDRKTLNWKMTPQAIDAYRADTEITSLDFSYGETSWGASIST